MALLIEGDDEKIPPSGLQIVRENVSGFLRETKTRKAFVKKEAGTSFKVLTPHKIFIADLGGLEASDALAAARFIGWRYLLLADGKAVAAAELVVKKSPNSARFYQVIQNPGVAATLDILETIEDLVKDDDYELRFLRMRDVNFSGLWFHCYARPCKSFVSPLPPAPKGMESGAIYPRIDFLARIQGVAENVKKSFLMMP